MNSIVKLFLLFVLIWTGCKTPSTNNIIQEDKNFNDLVIQNDFDWKTSQNIQFSIFTSESKVIRIYSLDNQILYHKGFFNQTTDSYLVSISIPKTVNAVLVNGKTIEINGEFIQVFLDESNEKQAKTIKSMTIEGLLALWHMDENSGSSCGDVQGGFDGVVNGTEWVNGISHSGLQFNGVDGGVEIAANSSLDIAGDNLSISFWFKKDEIDSDGCFMFHNTKYIVRINSHGKLTFAIYNPTFVSITIDWQDRIIDTDWHHVTATYDGSEMKLFVDSNLMVSKETSGNLNTRNTNVFIGNQSSVNFFSGIIDEVALYTTVLDQDDINTIYTDTPNTDSGDDSMVSWWPMNQSGDDIVSDEVGSNDGVKTGGSYTNGVVGNCLSFDGETDFVNIPNEASLDFSSTLTIMAWANTRDYKEAKIAQKGDWDGHGIGGTKWTGWKGHIRLANGGTQSIEWTEGRPLLNEWYHIALTYDGSQLKLYINGQLNNSMNVSGELNINNRTASIGSDNGGQKFFNGLIDEVKFFNTALSQTEIQTHFSNQNVATDSDGDGIPDTDEDFPEDPARAFINYFPADGLYCLAFEDLWPGKGDYDFNDLVVDYRFKIITNASNKLSDVEAKFIVRAIGAGFNNGLGFQFSNDDILANDLFVTGYSLENNNIVLNDNGLEQGQEKPTIIVFDNAFNVLPRSTGFGVNVEVDAPYVEPDSLIINIAFNPNIYGIDDLDLINFNPFLIVNEDRGVEIHLPDFQPTSLATTDMFGTVDDNSDAALGRYYKTDKNLPWAINIAQSYDYTIERSQIISAYLHFGEWAESSGALFPNWYDNNSGYRDNSHIYQVPD